MMASWFGACLRSEHLLPRHVGVLVLNSVIFSCTMVCVCNRHPSKGHCLLTILKSRTALTDTMLKETDLDPTVNIASAYRWSLALNLQGRTGTLSLGVFWRAMCPVADFAARNASSFMHVLANMCCVVLCCGMYTLFSWKLGT